MRWCGEAMEIASAWIRSEGEEHAICWERCARVDLTVRLDKWFEETTKWKCSSID